MSLSRGTRLGVYEIEGPLGAGGMGQVFRARDTQLHREVAIKVLYTEAARDEKRLRRLVGEARAASALNHPNIVTVYGMGEEGGNPYIVTELVDGETVRHLLDAGPIPLKYALELICQTLTGLGKAHDAGLVHRDIKPENLMVSRDGFVKILDFGLAKLLRPDSDAEKRRLVTLGVSATEEGLVRGTAAYMSPEQARGEPVGLASDLFSLGIILYEMVSGQNPFRRDTPMDTLSAILRDHPPPLTEAAPGTSAELAALVARSLSKRPEDRFTSAREMETRLRALSASTASASDETLPFGSSSGRRSEESVVARPRRRVRATVIAVAALLVAGGIFLWRNRAGPAVDSLAVLPFSETGAGKEGNFLGEGLAESVINRLSQSSGLQVVSRPISFRFRGRDADARQVGRELNVAALLTGRVTHRNDGVVVQTELIDVRTGTQLWGRQYNRSPETLPGVEREIAVEITSWLRQKLSPEQERQLVRRTTHDPEAYSLYLKGRYSWNRMTEEGIQRGIEYFQKAIERDPGYSLAHSGLAEAYIVLGKYGTLRPREVAPLAEAAARRAIELEPECAEAHAALADVRFFYDWKWADAEREFRRAIDLDAGSSRAHHGYGLYLVARGRFDEARSALSRAAELDPLSIPISADLAAPDLCEGNYDGAIAQYRKTTELDPRFPDGHLALGLAYLLKGSHREALSAFQKGTQLVGHRPLEVLIQTYQAASAGRRDEALARLREIENEGTGRRVPPTAAAVVYAFLEQNDDAIRWLENGYRERYRDMVFIKVDPMLRRLQGDPRFQDLLRRMEL